MGSRTVSWLRLCRTVRSPRLPMPVMVHRSPFLTQSVVVRRSRRSLAAGDDHIPDTGPIAVGQTHLGGGWGVIEAMITGAAVEFGDKLAGGGEHDRVQPG